jgi:hypothetical protein
MTVKDLAIQPISRLPDNADRAQVEERIHFVAGLRKGLYELDHGEGIAHNVVKEEFAGLPAPIESNEPRQGPGIQRGLGRTLTTACRAIVSTKEDLLRRSFPPRH